MSDVKPFSLERVAQSLRDEGYSCSYDEEAENVTGIWNEISFRFATSEALIWFRTSTTWEPPERILELDESTVSAILQEISNEWNRQHLQPTAYPFPIDGQPTIMLDYTAFVADGLSDTQIAYNANRALDVHLQAHNTLPSLIPPLF